MVRTRVLMRACDAAHDVGGRDTAEKRPPRLRAGARLLLIVLAATVAGTLVLALSAPTPADAKSPWWSPFPPPPPPSASMLGSQKLYWGARIDG